MAPAFKKRKTTGTSGPIRGSGGGRGRGVQQIDELKFDTAARQDYLTGFHKRKVQRIKAAREEAIKKEKEERVVHRREVSHVYMVQVYSALFRADEGRY